MPSAKRVAARFVRANTPADPAWIKNWEWPEVPGYTIFKGNGVGTADYRNDQEGWTTSFSVLGKTYRTDNLTVRGSRGKWTRKSEVPVILKQIEEAALKKKQKAPKDPVETVRLNADEVQALKAILDGERDGDLFSRDTTYGVGKALGWDPKKTYRILNGMARKGVLNKAGRVPIQEDSTLIWQGPDAKAVGWQLWEVYLPDNDGPVPHAALEQAGFKPWS